MLELSLPPSPLPRISLHTNFGCVYASALVVVWFWLVAVSSIIATVVVACGCKCDCGLWSCSFDSECGRGSCVGGSRLVW